MSRHTIPPPGYAKRLVAQALAVAAPKNAERAKALAYAAGRLGAFAESIGLDLEPEALLCPALIERFILQGTDGLSAASIRTLASNLRHLERALHDDGAPERARLPRERAKAPYDESQIAAFLACADAQATQARRMRATALICLGAGAGVIGSELRHLKGSDVIERYGGVLVAVGGKRARIVPVLGRFQEPLLGACGFAGEQLLLGGTDPQRKNLTCQITQLFCDPALPRLQGGRLRSTWLSACAERIGLHGFMAAAGICCSQRLGDIAASLPEASLEQLVALLGVES